MRPFGLARTAARWQRAEALAAAMGEHEDNASSDRIASAPNRGYVGQRSRIPGQATLPHPADALCK